ncbi:MAG: DNA helicase RecQ, partial [Planctomycetes bacterium]|nr:DNA helicase RecQ [Planctomycetota bacterium]
RAGRDGLAAECWLFYGSSDSLAWRRIIEQSSAEKRESMLRLLQQVMTYCTSPVCRHRMLLEHFGQQLARECRSCDVCLNKLAAASDSLVLAQKILSCVARCGERFGVEHIAKVLTGSQDAKVLKFGHERLSTWGLMKEHARPQIRDWINQLVGQRFLESVAVSGRERQFHVLHLSDEGRKVLRGEVTPALSKPVQREAAVTATAIVDSWEGVDRGLFEALRDLRRRLAVEASVPAYIVFSDATLRDLARRRPTDADVLQDVHGIGQRKAATYGTHVLSLIRDYSRQHALDVNVQAVVRIRDGQPGRGPNPSALIAFELLDQGASIADVSQRMNRAHSTVLDYVIEYVTARRITDPTRWVERPLAERIEVVASYVDSDRMKPIFDALHGQVDYDTIKIVLACCRNRSAAPAPPPPFPS